MRLAKYAKWTIPGLALWSYWRLPVSRLQTQKEPQTRIEIKFLSKNEFLNSMVNAQQSPALVIVFATSHLRKAEGQERERKVIQLSKDIAIALKDLPGVNVYLFRQEDFKVIEKALESTAGKGMPFKIDKEKEVHLLFKRPDYKGYFDMNEQSYLFTVDAISNKNYLKSLRRYLERLAFPVTVVNSAEQLKTELVRNIGINDRPVIIDVCKKQNLDKEKEKLSQYMLSRFEEKLISPYSTGILVNASLLDDQSKADRIGVIKNDFKVLHSFHSTFKDDPSLAGQSPEEAAQFYRKTTYDLMMNTLGDSTANFEGSGNDKNVAVALDDLVQPVIPLFLDDNTNETQKFYSHIFKNEGKKILGLNLLKADPQTDEYIKSFFKLAQSGKYSDKIGFQVFAESSQERMLKQLNRFYSPFCLYDLTTSVGNSYQKLFVEHPYLSQYAQFEANVESAIARSADSSENDKVMFSEDSIEPVSSRSFEFFQRKHRSKARLMLMLKPGDKLNLLYERHFLEKFGSRENVKVCKMEWPNSLGAEVLPPSYPSVLITTPFDSRPLLLDLPTGFVSAKELERFMATLDENVCSIIGH